MIQPATNMKQFKLKETLWNFTENVVLKKQVVVLVVVTDAENQLVDVQQIRTRHLQLISTQWQYTLPIVQQLAHL